MTKLYNIERLGLETLAKALMPIADVRAGLKDLEQDLDRCIVRLRILTSQAEMLQED